MAAAGMTTVKLLKADGAGHMQRIFDAYATSSKSPSSSSASTTPPALYAEGFTRLINDMVGDDAASLDVPAIFEVRTYIYTLC